MRTLLPKWLLTLSLAAAMICLSCTRESGPEPSIKELADNFATPPDNARPGVYWYFMDGNFSKEGITKDLEAMRDNGIGYVVFLEVNVGVPRGKVDFMSGEWLDIFGHIIRECKRTGIKMVLGIGPGWTGSGGPWVKGEDSMQHLVASSIEVAGCGRVKAKLEIPEPNPPYFGEGSFTPEMKEDWQDFYQDVCVLAFPTPVGERRIGMIQEKALYIRHPFSSKAGVKAHFEAAEGRLAKGAVRDAIDLLKVIDISDRMDKEGNLDWEVPDGIWTVMRFGSRNNGAATRPAPTPGVGMESDKFSREALRKHLADFTDKLFEAAGDDASEVIELLHLDSWEMGAQNWNQDFRDSFKARRGYDPLPYFPAYQGFIVGDSLRTERFLWDVRKTAQELVIENHVGEVKRYAGEHGQLVSIEPYDMNPTADLELAVSADVPMAEFWSNGFGFNTTFAVAEGTSAAHLTGQKVVPAESFTSHLDAWRQYPGSLKDQTDWALAAGINRIMFHTFQHQCLPDSLRPGMTMGPYGVHWDRGQTWWEMSGAYHSYLARCQYLLQQGRTVADILYLAPEGMPHVFKAPDSAYDQPGTFLPDRKGYNFDGCPPSMLMKAEVKDGRVTFPSGASYGILVLPDYPTATPGLLEKVYSLIKDGATVMAVRPVTNSPSLSGYPGSDERVASLSASIWGESAEAVRRIGKGRLVKYKGKTSNLYPDYSSTALILRETMPEDFSSRSGKVRYTHRTLDGKDIYFISNRTAESFEDECSFRVAGLNPELWDPMDGSRRKLPRFSGKDGVTRIPLSFEPNESFFIVFSPEGSDEAPASGNIAETSVLAAIEGPWSVRFDPKWGGPSEEVTFKTLEDWTLDPDPRIRYYSGKATYRTEFDMGEEPQGDLLVDLGNVKAMARVSLNGKDLGIAWTTPWRVEASGSIRKGKNVLEIEVVNLWQNRLIGDETKPYDGPQDGKWPQWLIDGGKRPSDRYTFTTWRHYTADTPLLPSGLLGPVRVLSRSYRQE